MSWLAGYPREKVDWYPTVDSEKCVKCGMCMNCGKKVFAWTRQGATVVNPYNCVVGCSTCGNLCAGRAISFPDVARVRELYKTEGIWGKVKKELAEAGRLVVT